MHLTDLPTDVLWQIQNQIESTRDRFSFNHALFRHLGAHPISFQTNKNANKLFNSAQAYGCRHWLSLEDEASEAASVGVIRTVTNRMKQNYIYRGDNHSAAAVGARLGPQAGDASMLALAGLEAMLEVVDARGARAVTDAGLGYVCRASKSLRVLRLSDTSVTAEGLARALARSGARVVCVDVTGLKMTDEAMAEIARSCPALEELHIGYVTGVTSEGYRGLFQRCGGSLRALQMSGAAVDAKVAEGLAELTGLETLDLSHCRLANGEVLGPVVGSLAALKTVSLAFTSAGAGSIAALAQRPSLASLDVRAVPGLPDLAPLLARGLKSLRVLRSPTITDEAVEALVRACPSLTHLELSDCQALTDRSLEAIAGLAALESLDMYGCVGVRGDKLSKLAEALTRLDRVNIGGGSVKGEAIRSLQTKRKDIEVEG